MTDNGEKVGQLPFGDPALFPVDKRILLAISHILPLPLKDVFLTSYYIHVMRHTVGEIGVMHQHEQEIEIQSCLEGEYLMEVAGQPHFTLRPGEGVVIAPRLTHKSHCVRRGARLTARARINGPRTSQLLDELADQSAGKLLPLAGRGDSMLISELLKVVIDNRPGAWQHEIIGGLLRAWVGIVLTASFDFTPWMNAADSVAVRGRGDARCELALMFIHANFKRPIDIDSIAQHVGLSARHLNRLFQRHVGESVNNTLRDVRLAEAFGLLSEPLHRSVKEVAHAAGFASASFFTRCFKSKYGILPSEILLNTTSLSAGLDSLATGPT